MSKKGIELGKIQSMARFPKRNEGFETSRRDSISSPKLPRWSCGSQLVLMGEQLHVFAARSSQLDGGVD
jgi:hypothetical protein